jgi:deoxyribose-phosphate aldolase
MLTAQDIADMIDHFLLRPELADEEVREGCRIFERAGAVGTSRFGATQTIAILMDAAQRAAEGRLKVGRDPG